MVTGFHVAHPIGFRFHTTSDYSFNVHKYFFVFFSHKYIEYHNRSYGSYFMGFYLLFIIQFILSIILIVRNNFYI